MQVRMRVKTSIGDPFNGYFEDDSKYVSNNLVLVQNEQQTAKLDILKYMDIADNHLFEIGNDVDGWQEHKVLIEGNYLISIVGTAVDIYEIKAIVDDQWSKNFSAYGSIIVAKNKMFKLPSKGKGIRAVKNHKAAKLKYTNIANAIKGKVAKNDIWKTISLILSNA